MAGRSDSQHPRFALKAAVAYAFFAALWIVASDFLVSLATGEGGETFFQLYKGLLFVGVTSPLLYFLLRQVERGRALAGWTGYETAVPPEGAGKKFGAAAPLAVFAGMALLIVASGYGIYSHQRDIFRQHKEQELVTVADLKVNSLVAWLAERHGDAETVRRDTLLAEAAQAWIKAGKRDGAQRQGLVDRLGAFWLAYGYRSVLLLDEEGTPILGAGQKVETLAVHEQNLARKALRRKEVQISDFHFHDTEDGKAPELDVMAPLTTTGGQAVGVVYFRIDPRHRLYPLLRAWPTPSETAEALLVRQEGDEVVFLSELDKEPGAALKFRLPVDRPDLPAALAARGWEGVVEGKDYHGDPVLAVVRAVPDSPWLLVVKVDRKEIFAELNRLAWVVAALTLIFVAVAGLIVRFWWRRQRDGFLLREYRLEMERRQLASRLEILSRYANDGIFLLDDRRRLLDFNQRVEELYRYSRDELLSMEAGDLRTPETRPALEDDWRRAEEGEGGGLFETLHQRKDGSVFPVEISLRRIESGGQRLHFAVVRDITERQAAEAKILRLKNLYAALSRSNEAIIHLVAEEELFSKICRVAVEQNGFLLAWVGMAGEDGWVEMKAASGPARDYVDSLRISVDGSRPEGQGPTGTAIREGRVFLCNDFLADPLTLPWRDTAGRFGIRASAAFPLRRGGKPVGALTLYADQAGFFDPEITALLEEMAADMSFALDHFDQEAARRRAEELLAESGARQRAMLDNIPDIAWLKDRESRYIAINHPFADACGKSGEELAGGTDFDIWPEELAAAYRADDAEVMQSGRRKQVTEELVTADGRRLWIETVKTPIFNPQGAVVGTAGIARDVTERKEAEEHITRLSNFYATLSQTNQAIVRSKGRQELFDEVCRVAVSYGKLQAAVIRTVEGAGHEAVVVAHYGMAGIDEELANLDVLSPDRQCPTATALLEGHPVVSNDFRNDPNGLPWRGLAENLNVRAVAAFPLFCEEKVEGALTLYAGDENFFNQQMVDLLQEMAMDLSFAMDNFVREDRRKAAEEALQEQEEMFRSINMAAQDAVLMIDDQGLLVYCNPATERILGYTAEELLGKDIHSLLTPQRYREAFSKGFARFRETGEGAVLGKTLELEAVNKSGVEFPVELSVSSLQRKGRWHAVGVMRDITERKRAESLLKASEQRFRNVVETVPDILYTAALPHFDTTYISPAVEDVLGFMPEDFIADPGLWFKLMDNEDRRRVAAETAGPFSCGAHMRISYRMRHQDGVTLKWFSDTFTVQCGDDGRPAAVTGAMADITERVRMEESLQQSEDRFRELFNNMHSAVAVYEAVEDGQDFVFRNANRALEQIEKLSRGDILGRRVTEVFPAVAQLGFLDVLRRVWQSGEPGYLPPAFYRDERIAGWRENHVYRLPSGEVVAVYDDVTERMAALEKLRLDAKVFEESAEGIMITDADLRIITVNRTFSDITGYTEAEVIGSEPSVLRSERHDQGFFQNMWAAIDETGHWVGEIWNRRKSGEVFPAWLAVSAVKDEGGEVTHYIGVFTDISTRKETEARIRHLIHYDVLTDLPNQFLLGDHIALALAHARRLKCFVAVMEVNLDRFRSVNERYGHSVGDRVLQEIATRLLGVLREGDTVARMGADNFAIVMPDLQDKHQANAVAGKVLETVAAPIHLDSYEINMTARVGIALYPDDGDRADTLMKNADIALASAKAAGTHNYVFFTPEQSRELVEALAMEGALRHAIERDELRLHYQPRLDLVSGEIVAVEALVRWQHPEQGLLAPGRFVALAERSGLILPIGEWVLREACRQAQGWHRSGFVNLRVSVNVSVLQLRQRNLVDVVKEVLEETGLNPAYLELEFTESFLMESVEETVGILRGLKDVGLRFSIDDFGTGYSSLSYLKLFPIDMLKIDQSFIRDITFDASDAAIVQGMIALGHSLKLRMVAEGVETEAQMGYLRSIHCDEMQGFFYSRPLPSTDMYALLQSNKRLQDIAHTPGTVRKLLVVDDEPNITTALNRLLRREGYQILIAHSAREALEILAVNGDVGVVLSDQRMPGVSGIELLSKVKVLYPRTMRMILSGYTELGTVTEAINQGEIYRFLTKPWEDDQLREVVREAFQRFELAKAEQQSAAKDNK